MGSTKPIQPDAADTGRDGRTVNVPETTAVRAQSNTGALPFALDLRIASVEQLERANIERVRQGLVSFQTAEQAVAAIWRRRAVHTDEEIMLWLSHPDERVAAAILQRLVYDYRQGVPRTTELAALRAYADRAFRDAAEQGVLWSRMLDPLHNIVGWHLADAQIMHELNTRRQAVQTWVRLHASPRAIDALLTFHDEDIRRTVVTAAPSIDAPLAAILVVQEDIRALIEARTRATWDSPWMEAKVLDELELIRRCAVEQLQTVVRSHRSMRRSSQLASNLIDALRKIHNYKEPLIRPEIDSLIECLPMLNSCVNDADLEMLLKLIANSPALTPEQIIAVYGIGPRLPRSMRSSRTQIDQLLCHNRAPVDFVRDVVVALRGPRWAAVARIVARHPTAVLDPVVRTRLCRSRDTDVLMRLCETARGRELGRLLPRLLRSMTNNQAPTIEEFVLRLLEDKPERVKWVQRQCLTRLFQSASGSIRERAICLLRAA